MAKYKNSGRYEPDPNAEALVKREREREREPWEQAPEETEPAFAAFNAYLSLDPPRKIIDAVRVLGKPENQYQNIWNWSKKWLWRDRARAHDEYIRREADKATIQAIQGMERRHVQAAMGMQTIAVRTLNALLQSEDLLPREEMVKWLAEGQRLERLARGEPTEIQDDNPKGLLNLFETVWERRRDESSNGDHGTNGAGSDVIDIDFEPNGDNTATS